ncbi:MAG: hypothetical protein R3C11_13825 [Planctomycetaceae bacterium]
MRYWILLIILLLELVLFAPLNGVTFDSWDEFSYSFSWFCSAIFEQSAPLLILSLGMTFVLMTGGIDLSIGSMVALIACVMSLTSSPEAFWYTGFPLGLLLGLGLGAFNGLLVSHGCPSHHHHPGHAHFLSRALHSRRTSIRKRHLRRHPAL